MTKPDDEPKWARYGLSGRINAAFFELMSIRRAQGLSIPDAALKAIDDLNKELRRTDEPEPP